MLVASHSISNSQTFLKPLRSESPNTSIVAYHDLAPVKIISEAKFPVYLTRSKVTNQDYALKIFPHSQEKPHPCYFNEIRFASLKHQNIVDMVHYEEKRNIMCKGERKKISYILMELAPYGDLFDFIVKYNQVFDEKLARTYFRQLITGIEYLHSHGVAHLDLKPENLLLGADFNLKIADFDLSYVNGDPKTFSKGTRYYRGPEYFKSTSANPEIKYPFAADIYSAGVILFVLRSGGIYPHSENDIWDGINYSDLFYFDNKQFWKKQCEIGSKKSSFYSKSFKELIVNMMRSDPEDRWTIKQIKQSKWYNGSVYSPANLEKKMKKILVS